MIGDLVFCNHESWSSTEQPCYINFDTTYIRGNTPLTEWPKPPPARREGSSILSATLCIKEPTQRDKERDERFAQRPNRSFLFERALFSDKTFIDCPARAASACSRRSDDWVATPTLQKQEIGYYL